MTDARHEVRLDPLSIGKSKFAERATFDLAPLQARTEFGSVVEDC
jgi:hypothetical protein